MEIVRFSTLEDMEQIKALWKICFHDSDGFMDWFFQHRYYPSLSSCLTVDDNVISALQSTPLHLKLRDKILPGSMLAGVSTMPGYEGRGYMKRIFLHFMQQVRSNGGLVAFHTPAHLPTFFSRGHLPATNTRHVDFTSPECPLPPGMKAQAMGEGLAPLHSCYARFAMGYSGIVSRTLSDFSFKFQDYAADEGQCLVLWNEDRVEGYCVYYALPDKVHAEEVVANSDMAYEALLQGLGSVAAGRPVHAKLPPDSTAAVPGAIVTVRPQGVMGIANVQAVLKVMIGDAGIRFAVEDKTTPQNAGVWDGLGQECEDAPHVKLTAGHLGQFLNGYAALEELLEAGVAAGDLGAIRELDTQYPKQTCFIVDEY